MRTLVVLALTMLLILTMLISCGSGGHVVKLTGTVQGYVCLDPVSGQPKLVPIIPVGSTPVIGASLSVRGLAITAVSDAQGLFTLLKVPCGQQTLALFATGYAQRIYSTLVKEGLNIIDSSGGQVLGKWTVLVYLCADNNLDTMAMQDLNEMEITAPLRSDANPAVTVLAQLDRNNSNTAVGSWTDTRRYQIYRDTDTKTFSSTRLDTTPLGELNMGDWHTLHDFIVWGQQYAPAEHYLVVLWDHGSGWDAGNDYYPALGAIARDDGSSKMAIRDAELHEGLTGVAPIDVVLMDACLMSCLEVAYQIRNQAAYMVSSEEETPDEGYYYADMMSQLGTFSASMTPREFAVYLAENGYARWKANGRGKLTTSAVDLSKVASVASAVSGLAESLIAAKSAHTTEIQNAKASTLSFGLLTPSYLRDIYAYAENVKNDVSDSVVQSKAQQVENAINNTVIANFQYLRPQAHGLSIYLRDYQDFSTGGVSTSYSNLMFAQDTRWDEWLKVNP